MPTKPTFTPYCVTPVINDTKFTVFGVAIRKKALLSKMDDWSDPYLTLDFYSQAIMLLVERYSNYLCANKTKRRGSAVFESIGPKEDVEHQLEFARILSTGTQWVPESVFRNYIMPGIHFLPKTPSHPLELADIFARDLFEWTRDDCLHPPKFWEAFKKKVYKEGDRRAGCYGVKIFPDSDIKEQIINDRNSEQ